MENVSKKYAPSFLGASKILQKTNAKWSDRMKECFSSQGVLWDDNIELDVKSIVADCVIDKGLASILPCRESVFSALVSKIEHLLKDI